MKFNSPSFKIALPFIITALSFTVFFSVGSLIKLQGYSADENSTAVSEASADTSAARVESSKATASKAAKAESADERSTAGEGSAGEGSEAESESSEEVSQDESYAEASQELVPSEESVESSESELSQPEELSETLSNTAYSYESLDELGCKQIITVNSSGSSAVISLYQKNGDTWEDMGVTTDGYIGSNGVVESNSEGSYSTPLGLFAVGEAFYIYDEPETGLDTFEITEDTYWVSDPDSKFYNMKVEGTDEKDWGDDYNDAEHMIEIYNYRYGFVIEYNTDPIVPGAGSAYFFHISDSSTAGCVGVSESMCLKYLKLLDSDMSPYILIL